MSRNLAEFCFLFCALQLGLLINAAGTHPFPFTIFSLYTVIGPGTIRSNFKYNVAVSVHKADANSLIKVGITGPSFNETKQVEVQPMSMVNVEFDVPKLMYGAYSLTATGIEGIIFENSTELNYKKNTASTFIQFDKATYKPADLVQFRVLFLDENTRPATIDQPITILINDGAQNRIKQLSDVKLNQGIYTGQLQLSEQPVLGTWNIVVTLADETAETKSFEVAKYVLPKFEVIVESAKDVAIQDGVIKATIRAKYTYGKPVKGKATVSLKPNDAYLDDADGRMDQIKSIDIDGKAHIEFPLQPNSRSTPPLEIFAVVTEDLTGRQHNSSTIVNLHAQRHKIEALDAPNNYHPNKSFIYQFVVKNLDGSPVQDATKKAKICFEHNNEIVEFEATLIEHGIATFNCILSANTLQYSITGYYANSNSSLGSIQRFQPEIDSAVPLKIQINTKTPKLGKSVSFDVTSNEPIPYFQYAIVARGNIVKAEHVEVPQGRKNHTVKFTPTFAMVPQASIYVYYISDNELRFEEKAIDFDKDFENSIEISAPLEAKPSEEVKLQIKTDANSYVGLLGVDQSVLLFKSGNDLTREDVFSSLNKYKTTTPWQQGSYDPYPGEFSGLVTLTNANYPYNWDVEEEFYTVEAEESAATSQIRKEFPETWIFQNNITTDAEGLTLTKKIPDTITSWVVTGFSLNPTTGFALTQSPSKIRVFRPFFVSTNLPHSVKNGEVIAIPVIIFNYMDKALDAEITMDNSDKEYEFAEATNEVEEKAIDEIQRVKRATIASNSGQSVSFMIRPKNVGTITLKINAITPLAGDAIQQKLKVEPEGVTKYENRAVFINLKADQSEMQHELEVEIPPHSVKDSELIEFSVVGDQVGLVINNLDNLVRMPYGCGEQNMVNFVPNILVLNYLEATSRKMPIVEAKAKKFLEIGYQRELTYKHDDGSYSAFGKSDPSGSTWLTAYVMRSFHKAAKYTDVDPKVIGEGLDFLASKQKDNGEFPEVGKLFDNSYQNELGLTSFVLLAFFENEEVLSKYQQTINKALEYVAQEVDKTDDQYSLSIAAVALQLAKHPKTKQVLAKLDTVAKQQNGQKWWSKTTAKNSTDAERLISWRPSTSNDIEITSYLLMALLEEEAAEATLPIAKWLIAQRNSNGGFSSTKDTVVGLEALTKFAKKTGSGSGTIDIDFVRSGNDKNDNDNDNKGTIKVNPENSLVLQSHVLPGSTRKVRFTAKGQGSAMVQLSYRYNIADKEMKPAFKVRPTVKDTSSQLLSVEVCAEYVPLESSNQTSDSNMAVMEIALPSGYVSDADSFDKIEAVDRVMRIDTKNSDSTVMVYFNSLTPGDVKCIPVEGIRAHLVAKQQPAAVSLYDYYETDRRATEYYQVASSLCDICEGSDCGSGCNKK
ncbi:CD109 antigen [Drosophila grimshawi]|uniref:CD109 antigen n=1 Tax=Drosophila grimshawi TaxID=7222 RepID=UPI001C93570A|nr:CD109 antigen [Drosophila grimshawi]